MRLIPLLLLTFSLIPSFLIAQKIDSDLNSQAIVALVGQYAQARETRDTTLLKQILTDEVDQLVSTGVWRRGKRVAVQGMLRSSASRPGTRKLIVESVRVISAHSAIADARYEIENDDGSIRKMWSTFIVVKGEEEWRIAGIRNMKPAK